MKSTNRDRVLPNSQFRNHEFFVTDVPNYVFPEMPNDIQLNMQLLCEHLLDPLRSIIGIPMISISGWRPEDLNEKVGGAKRSNHILLQAVDIILRGDYSPRQLMATVIHSKLPYYQMIDEKGRWTNWTHLSYVYGGKPHATRPLMSYDVNRKQKYSPLKVSTVLSAGWINTLS